MPTVLAKINFSTFKLIANLAKTLVISTLEKYIFDLISLPSKNFVYEQSRKMNNCIYMIIR